MYPSEKLQELRQICLCFEGLQTSSKSSYFINRIRYPQSVLMSVGGWDAVSYNLIKS